MLAFFGNACMQGSRDAQREDGARIISALQLWMRWPFSVKQECGMVVDFVEVGEEEEEEEEEDLMCFSS